jgi:rubrerythrin
MRENVMSAFLLAFMVILMAKTLAGIYLGGAYACPTCGTRREDEHAKECPWGR